MQEISQSRLASIIALLAGVWAALSPIWLLMGTGQRTNLIITGIIMALAALIQLAVTNTTPSWIVGLAAVWLFISAFIFSAGTAAIWSQVITAVVAFLMATWDGAELASLNQHQHHTGGAV